MSRGLRGLRPIVFKLDRVGDVRPEKTDRKRGRNGKRYPKRVSDLEKILRSNLNGVKSMDKMGDGERFASRSGCGTIRGAGSPREVLGKEDEPLRRVSRCKGRLGGGAEAGAARASSNGSGASPS